MRRSRFKPSAVYRAGQVLAGVLGLLMIAELVLRYGFGLQRVFRYVEHPQIEYMAAADQDVRRMGVHLISNAYGMRSGPVTAKGGGEFRALVIGDSVVHGEFNTSHGDLATTVISQGGVNALNASAVSWGPQNWLAYVNAFGTFDADAIVVVASSHDANDRPTFQQLNPDLYPMHDRTLILAEWVLRRVRLAIGGGASQPIAGHPPVIEPVDAFRDLLARPNTCVVLHATLGERAAPQLSAGLEALRAAAGRVPFVEGWRYVTPEGYRDDIHLNAKGQRQLGEAIKACIAAVRTRDSALR